jgi:hypothetical protein
MVIAACYATLRVFTDFFFQNISFRKNIPKKISWKNIPKRISWKKFPKKCKQKNAKKISKKISKKS